MLVLGAFMLRSLMPVFAAVPDAGTAGAMAGLVPVCTPKGIVYLPVDGPGDDGTPASSASQGGECCLVPAVGVPPASLAVAGPGWAPHCLQPMRQVSEPSVVFAAWHDPIRGPPGAFFSL